MPRLLKGLGAVVAVDTVFDGLDSDKLFKTDDA
jgi:hypothetical protein